MFALDKIVGTNKNWAGTEEQRVALVAIALMSDDPRAFDVMERRAKRLGPLGCAYFLSFMPPSRRDAVAWKLFEESSEARDEDGRALARGAAVLLIDFGSDDRAQAVIERLKSSPDTYLRSLASRVFAERVRLQRLLDRPDEDLSAWKAEQFRKCVVVSQRQVPSGRFTAEGLPTPYCVARATFPGEPINRSSSLEQYLGFCAEGAFWQALQETNGVSEIAGNASRPEELRRKAIKILVEAPKLADALTKLRRPQPPGLDRMIANAFSALRDLAKKEDLSIRTWVAEEILAHERGRNNYARIMGELAGDERLFPQLREKCEKYARGER
jgi:hypothetical protein